MKRNLFIVLLFVHIISVYSQQSNSNQRIVNWKLIDFNGTVDSVTMDTMHLNFQHTYPIDRYSISNSFNGNMGSPVQSKILIDRLSDDGFLFSAPYLPYLNNVRSNRFYNTKMPFSTIKLLTGGTNFRESDQVGFLFTANANKKLNFGTLIDYMYARGEYQDQAMKLFSGSLFGSYNGMKYNAYGSLSINSLSNRENGGIQDDSYILNPSFGYEEAYNIPVNLSEDAQSSLKQLQFYFTHNYSLGFTKESKDKNDSIIYTFVPVTRFTHTLKYDSYQKRYFELTPNTDFYKNTYYSATNDTSALQRLSNRLALNMPEEFNKFMRFGLTAFVHSDIERYVFLKDSLVRDSVLTNTSIGGELSKNLGQLFTYKFVANLSVLGYKAGDFDFSAHLGTKFRIWKDSIEMRVRASVNSYSPDFFFRNYESNHFMWNNNFSKSFDTRLSGRFAIPTRKLWFDLIIDNKTDYIFIDSTANPRQFSGSIQVLTAKLQKDFRFRKVGFDNTVIYQESFNDNIMPLPRLTLYHNLYYIDKWFSVLNVQLGTYVRYHTSYYAPSYMPATGFFYNQRTTKVGNYPVLNLYANFLLKRTRFFFEYSHVNQLFMKGLYYSMPNYPINPALLKMGLTWNFYD